MIVLDSSALVDLLLGAEPNASWVSEQVEGARWDLHAPHVVDIEVTGVVRRLVLAGDLGPRQGGEVVSTLAGLALTRYPHLQLLGRMWELRGSVSAPDAAFVALAEALDAPLVTTDRRLARVRGLELDVRAP